MIARGGFRNQFSLCSGKLTQDASKPPFSDRERGFGRKGRRMAELMGNDCEGGADTFPLADFIFFAS